MPKVSVIVAVYNVAPYLRRSMDCLMNQTMQDLEFICIDDCSTDGSLSILSEYEAKDNRFKIITSENNSGAAVARNKGLAIAKGEYIGFVDPDDEIDLNYYEELYKKAQEKDYDIVKCPVKVTDTEGKEYFCANHKLIKKDGLKAFIYEWTTAIYKSEIIFNNNIHFNETLLSFMDMEFLNKIVINSKNIALIDNVVYKYYRRNDSLDCFNKPLKRYISALRSLELVLDKLNEAVLEEDIYKYRYSLIFERYVPNSFKSNQHEAKTECAISMINSFHKCKNIEYLKNNFKYKCLLEYIEEKDVSGLTEFLEKFDNLDGLCKYSKCKKHSIVNIFGIKI